MRFPHVVCLAYEQDFEPTQTIPSIDAEIVHSSTYRTEGAAGLELGNFIRSLGYRAQVHSPNDNTRPLHSHVRGRRSRLPGRLRLPC